MRIGGTNQCSDIFRTELAMRASGKRERASGDCSGSSTFVEIDVTLFVGQDLVTRHCLGSNRCLVGHRSGRYKAGRFFSEEFRTLFLERNDRWVVTQYVVAEGRGHHGFAHAGGGLRHGIAPEIDAKTCHGPA